MITSIIIFKLILFVAWLSYSIFMQFWSKSHARWFAQISNLNHRIIDDQTFHQQLHYVVLRKKIFWKVLHKHFNVDLGWGEVWNLTNYFLWNRLRQKWNRTKSDVHKSESCTWNWYIVHSWKWYPRFIIHITSSL